MYYISSGLGNGMYTLREHNIIPTDFGFNETDHYVKTLARDFDKAVAKAKEFVGDRDVLRIDEEFDLEIWGEALSPQPKWEDTRTPEEIAAEVAEQEAKQAAIDAEYQEVKRLQQEAYDKMAPVPVTDERIKLTGVVEKTYFKDSQWGGSFRMFFIDDRGFKLNGSAWQVKYDFDEDGDYSRKTVPEGTRVSFMAKVVVSDDDPKFGFFKRPTKIQEI